MNITILYYLHLGIMMALGVWYGQMIGFYWAYEEKRKAWMAALRWLLCMVVVTSIFLLVTEYLS